jgi:hypothetical protein
VLGTLVKILASSKAELYNLLLKQLKRGSTMIDISRITSRLFTGGGDVEDTDIDTLVSNKITHVIDCRETADDASALAGAGIAYIHNGTVDDGTHKPVIWFQKSLEFALPAIAKPNTHLYAHCRAGCNRGPSTIYCIMRALGWEHDDAIEIIHTARPATVGYIVYADDADAAITALGYC